MRISDWSSDVCSSDLLNLRSVGGGDGKGAVRGCVALDIGPGEAATSLGRNGVGKTTLMKTIMGQIPVAGGYIYINGDDVTAMSAHERSRAGIGFVPQGRHVFPHLTVTENLEVGLSALARKGRSEEHTSELQSLMRISYALSCLK